MLKRKRPPPTSPTGLCKLAGLGSLFFANGTLPTISMLFIMISFYLSEWFIECLWWVNKHLIAPILKVAWGFTLLLIVAVEIIDTINHWEMQYAYAKCNSGSKRRANIWFMRGWCLWHVHTTSRLNFLSWWMKVWWLQCYEPEKETWVLRQPLFFGIVALCCLVATPQKKYLVVAMPTHSPLLAVYAYNTNAGNIGHWRSMRLLQQQYFTWKIQLMYVSIMGYASRRTDHPLACSVSWNNITWACVW